MLKIPMVFLHRIFYLKSSSRRELTRPNSKASMKGKLRMRTPPKALAQVALVLPLWLLQEQRLESLRGRTGRWQRHKLYS